MTYRAHALQEIELRPSAGSAASLRKLVLAADHGAHRTVVEALYRPRLLFHGRLLRVPVIALGSAPLLC